MGRQVRFYMLTADEQKFLDFVFSQGDVVLLSNYSFEPEPRVLDRQLALTLQSPEIRQVCLWNTVFPIDAGHFSAVYLENAETRYSIAKPDAPIIEFSRCFVNNDGTLVKGRIWAEMYRLDGDQLIHKGKSFEAWYNRIARWLRRHLDRIEGKDGYFGEEAMLWFRSGKPVSRF